MHEQEVARIGLLADGLRYAGCHRNRRNTGGADQRVHLLALREEEVHKLGKQQTSGRTESERKHTQHQNTQGLDIDERFGGSRSTDGNTEENHHDIHQLVLHGLAQTIDYTALFHQVTQHKAADQRSGARQEQRDDYGDDDREKDLLGFGNRAQLRHLDFTLFLGGQQTHDGRLNHRHEGHIRVSGHGDRTQQFGREAGGQEDRSRTVGTADDTDTTGLSRSEAQRVSPQEGHENTQLRSSTEHETLRVGDQRAEIGHGTDTDEDQTRVDTELHTQIKIIEQSGILNEASPVDMSAGEQFGMEHIRSRQVGQQHTESDREEQQRFELVFDGEVQEQESDENHRYITPSCTCESGLIEKIDQTVGQ